MMTKTVEADSIDWHELLAMVKQGAEIIITDGDTALARLLPMNIERVAGLNAGAIRTSDDFDAPLDDSFWIGSE